MLLNLLFFSIFLFEKAFCDNCPDFHCPAKWAYLAKTKSCYFVQDFTYPDAENWQLYNWTTADLNCKRMGAHLVSIHSVEEDNFVYELILSRVGRYLTDQPCYNDPAAWIGYFGSGIVGTGNWTDETPVDYIGRTPWTPWIVGAKMLNDPLVTSINGLGVKWKKSSHDMFARKQQLGELKKNKAIVYFPKSQYTLYLSNITVH